MRAVGAGRGGRILAYSEGGVIGQVKFRGRGGGQFGAWAHGNPRVPLLEGWGRWRWALPAWQAARAVPRIRKAPGVIYCAHLPAGHAGT